MEQIAVSFTDWGVPKTWLTPTINIIDIAGNKMVENWILSEVGYGWYIYKFDRYSPEKVYLYQFDGGSALSNDYDRYKFGWNDLDAYSNKYSWGRTAAPYFTSINWRFDKVDKAFKDADKKRYDDSEVKRALRDVRKDLKVWADLVEKLSELRNLVDTVNSSVKSESSSKWVSDINGKLDLMAEYVVKMKQDMDAELWMLDNNVAQRIMESNANLNEWMSNRVTIEQLLQQVERLENKMNVVLDTFVRTNMEWMLPKEITDRYDVNLSQKQMSDEDIMSALWMWVWEWMSEWLGEAREVWVNAPVDMQWIAEPEMPIQPM